MKLRILLLIFVTVLQKGTNARDAATLTLEQSILTNILDKYDNRIRPTGPNGTGPVTVRVNTYVRSIKNMDDVKMTFDTQLTFRQHWTDERLKYNPRGLDYLTLIDPSKIWTPDVFFSNELSGHYHNIITPNILLRIYPDGAIVYSIRISLTLACPMALANYPLDTQTCSIVLASYAYITEDIVLLWKEKDPVQITKNLHLTKFSLEEFSTDYCTSKTNTGEYSCLKVNMQFSRAFFFYLQRAYMPTAALVLLSWVVFWLNPKCINARLGIWLGILISIIIVTTSIAGDSPEVSYTKALDVWMGICVCFIFAVLLELCVVCSMTTEEGNRLQNQLIGDDEKNSLRIEENGKSSSLRTYTVTPLKWLNKYRTRGQRIDVACRFLFPVAFAFFNFVYWIKYAR